MGMLLDIFPIIVFFTVYKFSGIFIATEAAIAISALQVLFVFLTRHTVKPMQLITCLVLLILGGTTIILHNPLFIKWKPSIIYWLFALVFLGSHFIGSKPFIQHVMSEQISLPQKIWAQLNISWILFFTLMGFVNVYVLYHFNTNTWVNFKLFGILGLTIIFVVAQAIILSRFISETDQNAAKN